MNSLNLKISALPYSWRFSPKKGDVEFGAQIDLLFDRNDNVITLCEIKYTNEPFVLDKQYAEQLNRKMAVFKEKTRTKKQLYWAIISANGMKKSIYSEDMISGIITSDDLFQKIE